MPNDLDPHGHIARTVDELLATVRRADQATIRRFLDAASSNDRLDTHSLALLRQAPNLSLTLATVLNTLLDEHAHGSDKPARPSCIEPAEPNTCGILQRVVDAVGAAHGHQAMDAAEAWRRANLYLSDPNDGALLVHIQEFEDGFFATPICVALPEPPHVPTIETATGLVIDKVTGTVTRWPRLPLDVLAKQYRRYQRDEPMTFTTDNAPGHRARHSGE
ncbi:hypothetical protein [Actinomadura sp. 9N407]|uniref:hypothetical protein n=1 Tax=Actinomadura sp. 9N407 TaxID=3375154 RepID=UPI0037B2684D